MKRWIHPILTPILLFLLMLIDSHITLILSNLTGNTFTPVSHIFLIVLMYATVKHRQSYLFILALLLGIIYDSYFIGIFGLASAVLPLLSLFFFEVQSVIFSSRFSRVLTIIIATFLFETIIPALELLFNLITINIPHFVTYQLALTLVLNIFLAIILQWLFEKIYGISKT